MKMNFKNLIVLSLITTAAVSHAATESKAPAETKGTDTKKTEVKNSGADSATSAAQKLAVDGGTLEFFAIGKPSMLKIHGESVKLSGTATKSANTLSADLEVPLASFETGMKVRNDHLKEKVFETSKFEKAKLSITKLELPPGKTGEIKDLPFTGKLNLHGVEKEITGTATVNVGEKSTSFTAETNIKMTDYKIPPPEFMGMTIQDQVKVTATGEAKL